MTWVMWHLIVVLFGTVLVSVQDRSRFAPNVPLAQKSFWMHPMVLLGDEAQVVACFGPFRDSDNVDAR